jgi:hypothetical protein
MGTMLRFPKRPVYYFLGDVCAVESYFSSIGIQVFTKSFPRYSNYTASWKYPIWLGRWSANHCSEHLKVWFLFNLIFWLVRIFKLQDTIYSVT